MPTLLSLRNVARTYPGPVPVHALRPATFDVQTGELIALVGRSGSGKSTLLNVMSLLDEPTSGTYTVAGREVGGLSDAWRTRLRGGTFGFVFQQPFLMARRSAQENVEVGLLTSERNPGRRRVRAVEILERVGLADRRRALPGEMSGGECQRVVIARAVAQEPQVLVCDEPTGNLDEATASDIFALLRQLNDAGVTIIVATHDPGLATQCPRELVLRDGMVSEQQRARPPQRSPSPRDLRSLGEPSSREGCA